MTLWRTLAIGAVAIMLAPARTVSAQVAPVAAITKPVERLAPVAPLTEPAAANPVAAAGETTLGRLAGRVQPRFGARGKRSLLEVRWALLGAGVGSFGSAGEFFGPASRADLDRIAFAADGAESSHGTDPRMWRLEPNGPQGPMQVSLAAAIDVGGGDRFDFWQNRLLGRAYLAHLYQRYGNWPDAVAAYNWGPGNLEAWVASGRPASGLPFGVGRYVERVLREAAFGRYGEPFGLALSRAVGQEVQPVPGIMLAGYRMLARPGAAGIFANARRNFSPGE
jgi:hypothetical protein